MKPKENKNQQRLKENTLSLSFVELYMSEELEERLIAIESSLAVQEKFVDDLNQVVIEQGKIIERLVKQNQYLLSLNNDDVVRPLSEETPPPHY